MTYTLLIKPEAEAEVANAYRWNEERDAGLGSEFLRSVDAGMSAIQREPLLCQLVHGNVRRYLLRRFPYGIFYMVEEGAIVVIACFHARQSPKRGRRGAR